MKYFLFPVWIKNHHPPIFVTIILESGAFSVYIRQELGYLLPPGEAAGLSEG